MAMDYSAGDVLEHVELNNMVLGLKNSGVVSDPDSTSLSVGEKPAPDMGVKVELGNCSIDGVAYATGGSNNLVIEAAHATLHRKDLISFDSTTGNPLVTKGTDHAGGDADPIYPPDIPAGDILLAIVAVDAAATTIVNADITDARVFITTSAVPTGTIVMWHGLLANIPTGWVLCNGANSTPDLREKFIRGAANGINPGGSGGSNTHTHVTATDGDHVHDYTSDAGAHQHDTDGTTTHASVQSGATQVPDMDHVHDVVSAGTHYHDVEDTGSEHSHNVNAGSTLPAYYSIAYIMKS